MAKILGTCTVRYWGVRDDGSQAIVWERKVHHTDSTQILKFLGEVGKKGFLIHEAGFFKVECFWSTDSLAEHRQWCLLID